METRKSQNGDNKLWRDWRTALSFSSFYYPVSSFRINAARKPVAAWVLTTVLAAETVFMALRVRLDFPFLAPALLGAVVVQIRTRRCFELLATVPLAAGLALVRFGLHLRLLRENAAHLGVFLGLASLFFMGVAVLRSRPNELPERIGAFGVAMAAPVFVIITAAVLSGTGHAHPVTLDRVLYAFDGSLGFQPSFLLGRLLARWAWLGGLAKVSYEQVPVAVLILYTSRMGAPERTRPNVLLVIGAASLVGYLLYALLPAAGPLYLFPSRFPNSAPPLAGLALLPVAVAADIPRNAMPSLHMAWAVLLWWNARRSAFWVRAGYGLYLALTVLFTLGSGEHYLIDLVVALPFALAVQAAFLVPIREMPRSWPFCAGTLATLAWLGFLRFAAPVWLGSFVLDWSLVAVTVVGLVTLERQASWKLPAPEKERRAVRSSQELEAASVRL